jgi:amidophosphoribosyltransferase
VVLASERPVIQTAFNVHTWDVTELNPGEALLISKHGDVRTQQIIEPKKNERCSFERIYFSRGSDKDIYNERKALGRNLVPAVLKSVDNDLEHTVFSFIPNTAEVAFFGLTNGLNDYMNKVKKEWILEGLDLLDDKALDRILSMRVRAEKVAIKDIKLRTFIAEGASRNDLAAHVYDITYGSLVPFKDNLVIIDDSIVRGTTLKQSIIGILDRLHPKKIVIVSSSPQVRYPDYYGIDMSRMDEFIAFKAAVALLEDRGMANVMSDIYEKAKEQEERFSDVRFADSFEAVNFVKEVYAPFTDSEISVKIAELLKPASTRAEVEIVYQTIEGLHESCPNNPGDWYFSGDYPTPGGTRMVNKAFINFMEKVYLRKTL